MLLTMISVITSFFISEPARQDSITLYAYWNNHETQKYEIQIWNDEYEEGELIKSDSIWSLYQIEVIDSTEETYTLQLSPLDFRSEISDIYEYMESYYRFFPKNIPVIYETSTEGNFTRIINAPEIIDNYQKELDSAKIIIAAGNQKRKHGNCWTHIKILTCIYLQWREPLWPIINFMVLSVSRTTKLNMKQPCPII